MDEKAIQELIDKEIKKTQEQIEEYKELSKPEAPDVAIGRVSRMDAINNRSIIEAALVQAEIKLSKLEQVKDKIGSPDFGKCAKCKQDIPVGRILIKPESIFCVRCAQ